MTQRIETIPLQECLHHDPAPVAALYRDHGPRAHRILRERLSAVALHVALAADQVAARDLDDLPAQLRQVQRMSADLGLLSVAEVAGAAAGLVGWPPFPAVFARLQRLTEMALHPSRDLLQASH